MPSRRQADLTVKALNGLSEGARKALSQLWFAESAGRGRVNASPRFAAQWMEVLNHYGQSSAELGEAIVRADAAQFGIDPVVKRAASSHEKRALARFEWAMSQPDQWANLVAVTDELVKQPFRSTVQRSAHASGIGWARVPSGSETCGFCLMLASRGGVYHSKEIAQLGYSGEKYHPHCDCVPMMVRGPQDYPDGYDPSGLYAQYDAAASQAVGPRMNRIGKDATRKIVAELDRMRSVARSSAGKDVALIEFDGNLRVPAGLKPPPAAHQLATARKIAAMGHKVEFLPVSNQQGVTSADLLINGEKWEMKAPAGAGKNTISHQLERASKQCDRLVLDLVRTDLNDDQVIAEVRRRIASGSRIRMAWVIRKDGLIVEIP